ncbi:IS66-like element accessory protein TnpA [Candidatus Glomeribacter gigasporarum]|uniref:IS66-like element accessory protein TnpA n=1 Tax=Candidatus Glomeribacter gigasporarum TaxID=132144 RepID=UPI0005B2C906|nr:transposase [Candidatus Glomeribacter gigasporarum]
MDESVCDGLPIIRVKRDGSRIFDPQAKSRLVEACLQPGVSIASLALSHGVNANLLHKWIRRDRRAREKGVMKDGAEKLSAFVPVIQNKSAPAIRERPACMPALSQSTRKWPDPAKPSRLNAYLPNGVRLTLECLGQDAELVCAMIETLGRGDVSSGR